MKVFVFEHVCGGGRARCKMPGDLSSSAAAMLQAVVEDLLVSEVRVSTTLDERLDISLGSAEVHPITPATDLQDVFQAAAATADATLVIAPESRGILVAWLCSLKSLGARSLNSKLDTAATCADKLTLARHLSRAGVPAVPARVLEKSPGGTEPRIVKPRFGAGCARTFICRTPEDYAALPKRDDWIMQPLMSGISVSCSLIVHKNRVMTLPCGEQLIEAADNTLQYRGGRMPLAPELSDRAADLARRAAEAVPGLRGFAGIDMCLGATAAEDVVFEINPRLTLSYVGLRALCQGNIAQALLDESVNLKFSNSPLRFDACGSVTAEPGA